MENLVGEKSRNSFTGLLLVREGRIISANEQINNSNKKLGRKIGLCVGFHREKVKKRPSLRVIKENIRKQNHGSATTTGSNSSSKK